MTNQGDNRTPDKTIGQIKYADDKTPMAEKEKTGPKADDKRHGDLQNAPATITRRRTEAERKGPFDKELGRKHESEGSRDCKEAEGKREDELWPGR